MLLFEIQNLRFVMFCESGFVRWQWLLGACCALLVFEHLYRIVGIAALLDRAANEVLETFTTERREDAKGRVSQMFRRAHFHIFGPGSDYLGRQLILMGEDTLRPDWWALLQKNEIKYSTSMFCFRKMYYEALGCPYFGTPRTSGGFSPRSSPKLFYCKFSIWRE
jgi:hypothetical protein